MKVFVWHQVDKCSDSYHCEGGVVVFADSEDRARELANSEGSCAIRADEHPDRIAECEHGPEQVFIMPNAGCC